MKESNQIRLLIEAAYCDFRPSERKAADYILKHLPQVPKLSLGRLAEQCKVSQPTIVRMVKAAGFLGYKDFQYALVEENGRQSQNEPWTGGLYGYQMSGEIRLENVPAKIVSQTAGFLQNNLKALSTSTYCEAVNLLKNARMIDIYAVENSGATAQDLATKLLYLGLNCRCYSDAYLQRISSGSLSCEDAAVGISYTGQSKDTVEALKAAKQRGARTIAITNFQGSLIGEYADLLLCTSQEQMFYGDAIFSRTSQMMLIDMLYMGIVASDHAVYESRLEAESRSLRDKAYE